MRKTYCGITGSEMYQSLCKDQREVPRRQGGPQLTATYTLQSYNHKKLDSSNDLNEPGYRVFLEPQRRELCWVTP